MNEWVYVVRWQSGVKLKQREFDGPDAEAESAAFYRKVVGNKNEAERSRSRKATVGDRVVATGRGMIKKIWGA